MYTHDSQFTIGILQLVKYMSSQSVCNMTRYYYFIISSCCVQIMSDCIYHIDRCHFYSIHQINTKLNKADLLFAVWMPLLKTKM